MVDEGNICHVYGGSGIYRPSGNEEEFNNLTFESYKICSEAWNLYLNNKYEDALYKINQALNFN